MCRATYGAKHSKHQFSRHNLRVLIQQIQTLYSAGEEWMCDTVCVCVSSSQNSLWGQYRYELYHAGLLAFDFVIPTLQATKPRNRILR